MKSKSTEVKAFLLDFQNRLCELLEKEDEEGKFIEDIWQHSQNGGGGRTRILLQGKVFEQVGINFSHVCGSQLPEAATKRYPEFIDCQFEAMGVSAVFHALNPFVPTSHLNIRFFIVRDKQNNEHWWFGGGYDLTPFYGFKEDCQHWHQTAKNACDSYDVNFYPLFKKACDEYFYLKHRQEARGIGGIIFDDFNQLEFSESFNFIKTIGNSFWLAYQPIISRRKLTAFGPNEKNFQLYRRGRYVEFNLVWDRGTLFGLQFGGRTESILMSLPPQVIWRYNWHPEPGSKEADLYEHFLPAQSWV